MTSLGQIRTALKTVITGAVPSLTGYETVPESVNVPAVLVVPTGSSFQRAMGRGLDVHTFDLLVLVARGDDQIAQSSLDEYVNGFGAKSIREAIWNNRSLGLVDIDTSVAAMSEYGARTTIGATDYVSARLSVEVMTSGTA